MSERILPAIAKVVICGAGVIGNSIAYNLVKRGWTDIIVLEKGRIGCGATWRSSGLVGQLQPTVDGIIARSSAKLYQELHDAGHDIAGVEHKVGWAFGLGLERIAMALYRIPDIRAFWSADPAFLAQFEHNDPYRPVVFRALSDHPPCLADMSFWAPAEFTANDFFDLVRSCGGDLVERVEHRDTFTHPKTNRTSYCYRLVYRHMERPLVQEEANVLHRQIGAKAEELLGVELRIK